MLTQNTKTDRFVLKIKLFKIGEIPERFKSKLIVVNSTWPEIPTQFIRDVLDFRNNVSTVKKAEYSDGRIYLDD